MSDVIFSHAVFCQVALPYEPPKSRVWQREVGDCSLRIEAGSIRDMRSPGGWKDLPLPYGKNPRLILMHLSNEALRTNSPNIEVEDSMTAFAAGLGIDTNGRNLRELKAQLGNLSVATIRLGIGDHSQVNGRIVSHFDLWFPARETKTLWPSTVHLDASYFESLRSNAVPLDNAAIVALKHSAAALDCYSWMAYTLHRLPPGQRVLVTWDALYGQFGQGYKLIRQFRYAFKKDLAAIQKLYPKAEFELDRHGVTLRQSPPPLHGDVFQMALSLDG
jgi:hypothetical protein